MEAAVPIGLQGIAEAINLYNCVAKEKKCAIRGKKALQQKWDKVREVCLYVRCQILTVKKVQTT